MRTLGTRFPDGCPTGTALTPDGNCKGAAHPPGRAAGEGVDGEVVPAPARPTDRRDVLVVGDGAGGFEALRRARPQPEQPVRRRRAVDAGEAAVAVGAPAVVAGHGAAGVHRPAARRLQQAAVSHRTSRSFTLLIVRQYLAQSLPVFSRFLRVFTVSPRRFQRTPSRHPGPTNGGKSIGDLRPSFGTPDANQTRFELSQV